jgi:hypothetical protein
LGGQKLCTIRRCVGKPDAMIASMTVSAYALDESKSESPGRFLISTLSDAP